MPVSPVLAPSRIRPNALHAAIDSAEPAARKIASQATTQVGIGRINDCVYLGLDIWYP